MDDARTDSNAGLALVGYDGSDTAERGLARAAELVGAGGTVLIVGVEVEASSASGLAESLIEHPSEAEVADAVAQAAERLAGWTGVRIETAVLRGDPATVLVTLADQRDADLIVVGRRGRDFAARVVLGSVAERVVQRARCDVLVVG